MYDRFLERCKSNPKFCGADSIMWCRKYFDRTAIRLKPVSAAADEWGLVFLNVCDKESSLRINLLEDLGGP